VAATETACPILSVCRLPSTIKVADSLLAETNFTPFLVWPAAMLCGAPPLMAIKALLLNNPTTLICVPATAEVTVASITHAIAFNKTALNISVNIVTFLKH